MVKTHFSLLGIISYIGYTLTSDTHYTLKYILLDSSQIYTIFSLVDKTSQVTNPEIMINCTEDSNQTILKVYVIN